MTPMTVAAAPTTPAMVAVLLPLEDWPTVVSSEGDRVFPFLIELPSPITTEPDTFPRTFISRLERSLTRGGLSLGGRSLRSAIVVAHYDIPSDIPVDYY